MKFRLFALILVSSARLLAQQPSVPEISYESIPNFLKPPANMYFGEAAGVALDSKGDVFVYNRGEHTALFGFDPRGNYMRTIG